MRVLRWHAVVMLHECGWVAKNPPWTSPRQRSRLPEASKGGGLLQVAGSGEKLSMSDSWLPD